MELTYNQLRCKEVVNLIDGSRLGRICDIVFQADGKCVLGLVVPCTRRLFKPNQDLFIPFSDVVKFGDDVILVNLCDTNVITKTKQKKAGVDEDFII